MTLLKIAVTLFGLLFVLWQVPFSQIVSELQQARLSGLGVAVGLIVVGLMIRAVRWLVLLRGVGGEVGFGRLLQLYFIGAFFNGFLPSGFGGDAMRILELSQDVPQATAAGTVLVDRISGLVALFVLAIGVLVITPTVFPADFAQQIGVVSVAGLLAGTVALGGWRLVPAIEKLVGMLPNFLGRPINKLLAALRKLSLSTILKAILISFLFNLTLIAMWQAVGWALRYDISFFYLMGIVPILSIALLVPSVGGLGVREAIAPLLLMGAGLTTAEAVTLSLTVAVVQRVAELSGAFVYLHATWQRASLESRS